MDGWSVTKSFNIELDNNTLEQYEKLLSNFSNWKEYKREIKLNSILEDKKIEFTLDISAHTLGVMYVNVLTDDDYDYDRHDDVQNYQHHQAMEMIKVLFSKDAVQVLVQVKYWRVSFCVKTILKLRRLKKQISMCKSNTRAYDDDGDEGGGCNGDAMVMQW